MKIGCFAFGVMIFLAGCGQSGPLYLPAHNPAAAIPPTHS